MANELIFIIILTIVSVHLIGFLILLFGWKRIVKNIVHSMGKIVITDSYEENITELIPGVKKYGLLRIIENSLRAERPEVLHRPLGSVREWPSFDAITFIPAQTGPFPIDKNVEIDMKVLIGPKAKKPLRIGIPLMITGMAYGVGLSKQAKIALAQASARMNTAINSGEGGILPEERQHAKYYILQFSKTEWAKEEEHIKNADMIEIKFGQGALAGMGSVIPPEKLKGRAREVMNLQDGEDAIIHEQFFENQTLEDFKELIDELRTFTKGIPIGVKMMAGGKIEQDINHLLQIGVDFITIDGGQASTHDAPPILQDDFGIPTLHALIRADQYLKSIKKREDVSLIVSGGLSSPGDFLKVLALGADAIYVGSAILFALSHSQSVKPLPFEPPTQMVWYNGKFANQFNIQKGADAAYRFLYSSTEEMKMALRAMGKTSLKELTRDDLVTYDKDLAQDAHIPYTFHPLQSE
jgi:methylamine---glutamate N-methyltransferase subunit C